MRALLALLLLAPGPALADEIHWVDGDAPASGEEGAPRERDTTRRLTGEDLIARGATTLADALDLIPEISVRAAGRGGQQADLRGARKSWLKILVDGVPVDDPYHGNFDLSSIPATDIVEVRVSLAPASPLDGPGGPGGVIEVITLAATGEDRLAARAQASDAPEGQSWVSGRTEVVPGLGVRLSAGGTWGGRDYDVTMDDGARARLGQDTRQAAGSLRLGTRRLGLDLSAQHRRYAAPPSEEVGADVLVVDGETTLRLGAWGQTRTAGWRMRGEAHAQLLERDSRGFADASLARLASREALSARRAGLGLVADRPLGAIDVAVAGYLDLEAADVTGLTGPSQGGTARAGELAGGLTWRHGGWRAAAAAGLALPGERTPWPEGKLAVGYGVEAVDVELVAAHKGRVPTLRERFQLGTGNDGLAPERASSLDANVKLRPAAGLELDAAGYVRTVTGYIRLDLDRGQLANLGRLFFVGGEATARWQPLAFLGVGGAWRYQRARGDDGGSEPLDFLPRHRADAWLTVKARRVGVQTRLRYVDTRIDQRETLPAYVTADVSGSWTVSRALRTTLRVDNLADRRFPVRAHGYRDPGRLVLLLVEAVWP